MDNLSIFILDKSGHDIIDEIHDLSPVVAYKIAMDKLYNDGILVPHISVVIRDSEKVIFSATNP
jgi:hypothetical protein